MPAIVKPLRFAHSEGQTDVCYDETGEHLLTCGSDGDIRIYKGFDDSDPESIQVGEYVTMVAVKNKRIFAAPDNFAVQALTFPEGSPDGILTRFTAAVNHMCFNQSGTVIAACSSDFTVKIVTLEDSNQKSFRGHKAPVLAVSLDPKDVYLASSSCDGSIKIWKIEDQSVIKSLNLLPKVNDTSASKSLARLAWQPGAGKYLAIPADHEVKIYERDSWNLAFGLANDEHNELVSLVSWSPCGNFLASANIDGNIVIWDISSHLAVERMPHESKFPICNIVWNPLRNREIAYVDNQGQFGICENVIPDCSTTQNKNKNASTALDENGAMVDAMMNANYDSDNDSLVATKRHRVKMAWIDDEAEDDDEDDEFKDIRKLKAELAAPLDFADDGDADTASEVSVPRKPTVVHVPVVPTLQPAFQPGSTPAHLMHRFMVWNSIGIVRCHTEDELSSIEVEFHDTSTHHPLHLTNHLNHTMAALSPSVVLLACKAQDDIPSKLVCLHFGSWDSSKEWTMDIPSGENIEAVAAGDTWVAVTTSKLLVRVFTITGIQRHMFSIPGPVVSMSGHGSQLLIAYHAGNPLPNEQALGVKIVDIAANRQIVADQRLTISKKSTLSWIGFSEEGTPVTADSCGIIRMLNRSFGDTWVPVLDTKSQLKGKSDNYWVVGLEERTQQLRCILCKGSTYPPTLPRPIILLLPLKLPLCEMATDKGEKEENYMKSCLLTNNYKYREEQGVEFDEDEVQQAKTTQIQTLMRLFALACKTDREFRAAEYCELLPDQRSVSLAIKYAAGNRKMNLAQRLNDLAFRKAQEEAQGTEDEFGDLDECPRSGWSDRSASRSMRTVQTSRRGSSRQHEDESEEDDMEVENEADDEEQTHTNKTTARRGLSRLCDDADKPANPLLRRSLTKSDQSTPSPSLSSMASQGRANPFKVLSPSMRAMGACGKSFFQSVEEEKTVQASKTKTSPNTNSKAKKSKQTTLLNRNPKTADKPVEKPAKPDEQQATKTKNGFTLWLEENRARLAEEHPEVSDGELIKLAMKQWRVLASVEKKEWNDKAKGTAGESDDKKRKRENNENDNENSISSSAEKMSKKIKATGTEGASSKLAGFAFSKN